MIRELKILRRVPGKFTIICSYVDYGAFPYDGTFPSIYYYIRVDTEEELINELKTGYIAGDIPVEDIETIYYGFDDVTDNYQVSEGQVWVQSIMC